MRSQTPPATAAEVEAAARRMRVTLIVMFALFGTFATSWGGRMPSIREALGISSGQLGAIMVAGSVGALISVTVSGAVVTRFGPRRTLHVGNFICGISLTLVGLGVVLGSLPVFVIGVALNANPFINVTSNLEGARVEKLLHRAVLPQLHAAFPVGAALGSVLAAVTARLAINAGWYIIAIALSITIVRVFLIGPGTAVPPPDGAISEVAGIVQPSRATKEARKFSLKSPTSRRTAPPDNRRTRKPSSALSAWTEPRTLMLGMLLFAATMSEGSAGNWLNLAVVDGFGTQEQIGSLAYGTFVASMLVVRVLGARLLARFGRLTVLYASGATALVGLLVFGLAPALGLAWLGIMLWGAGAAMVWPTTMGAAADDPVRAAARVSVVSAFSSVSMLAAPPVLGLVADSIGVRRSLLLIVVTLVVSLFMTRAARPEAAPTLESVSLPSPP